jgi:hypothetical protein
MNRSENGFNRRLSRISADTGHQVKRLRLVGLWRGFILFCITQLFRMKQTGAGRRYSPPLQLFPCFPVVFTHLRSSAAICGSTINRPSAKGKSPASVPTQFRIES